MPRQNILVLVAHSDDQIIGSGATMAKYTQQGNRIKTVIFSHGEKTHPHLQKHIISRIRQEESEKADKVIGGKGVLFLGLREWHFQEEYPHYEKKLRTLLKTFKPAKIFTHSVDDGHPDHMAVHQLVISLYDKMKLTCDLYTFDVWTPFNLKKRENPWLLVDVSKTFSKKLTALKCFRSQYFAASYPMILSYLRGHYHGFLNNTRYAEIFYKVR